MDLLGAFSNIIRDSSVNGLSSIEKFTEFSFLQDSKGVFNRIDSLTKILDAGSQFINILDLGKGEVGELLDTTVLVKTNEVFINLFSFIEKLDNSQVGGVLVISNELFSILQGNLSVLDAFEDVGIKTIGSK